MRQTIRLATALLAFAVVLPGPAPAVADDDDLLVLKLASETVGDRLAALRQIAEGNREDAETLLLSTLDDRDWEVVERACLALARHGSAASLRPLGELALTGPVRRIRLAAAAALGATIPAEGAELVSRGLRANGNVAAYAAEALGEIRHPSTKDMLLGAIRARDPELRRQAAQALGSLRDASILDDIEPLFVDPDIGVRAGAAEALARGGDLTAISRLLTQLQNKDLMDLIERRIVSAIRRLMWANRDHEERDRAVRKLADAFRNERDPIFAARIARTLGSVGRALPPLPEKEDDGTDGGAEPETSSARPAPTEDPGAALDPEGRGPVGDPEVFVEVLGEVGLQHRGPEARRAAVAALGRIGGAKALEWIRGAASEENQDDALVRFHALRAYGRWKTAKDETAFQLFAKALRYDKSKLVREEAAVRLGVADLEGAVETLAAALKDKEWEVVVSTAISLGKTRDPRGPAELRTLLEERDWRLRGGAVAGLGWSRQKEVIPDLIAALADKESCVRHTAWAFLKRLTDKALPLKQKEWEAWWDEKGAAFAIIDREAELRDAKKHGYALNDRDVYEDLDVVVLSSRGDSIEKLLETLEIQHRLTRSKGVKKDGLQPFGVFVANCTGEVQPEDHERIQWFVHAGGALFGSCWAIDKTIGEEFPNTIRKFPGAAGQVLDQVRAEQLPTESEYLDGVFPGSTRPIYQLYGAFLIEVLDPERCEVLIDSPDCASRWNGGNLAAWFTSGHGVVMGSSNHFDRQTLSKLQNAKGVSIKNESDRMAFAIDHFGFGWEQVRELDARGVFGKQSAAEKEVTDLSAFRFLTNFVRRKRIIDL